MDAAHFDTLLATLATTPSRRGVLRVLSGLGLASLLGSADTMAKHKHKHRRKKKHHRRGSPPPVPPSPPASPPAPGRGLMTQTFTNGTPITIPGTDTFGIANPYPAEIVVNGFTNGVITDVNVSLFDLSHTFVSDLDILLAASHLPGLTAVIMSDVSGVNAVSHLNLVLDDQAASRLPKDGPFASGTFKPTNRQGVDDTFPAPAPSPSGTSPLSVFTGQNPNGTWQLFVVDDLPDETGSIAGGWALQITAEVDL